MTQAQVSAQATEFPPKNIVFIAGTITNLLTTGCIVRSTHQTVRHDGETRDYADENPVMVSPELLASMGFEEGSRIQLYGLINQGADRIRRVFAYGKSLVRAAAPTDANTCEIVGKIGTVTYTPADPVIGKYGFARATVVVAKPDGTMQGIPVLFFQQMARNWEKVPRGSEVRIVGRVRTHEHTRADVTAGGDIANNKFTEIVADPSLSRVLKRAVVFDPFAGVDVTKFEDIEPTFCEAGAEATAIPAPGSKSEPFPREGSRRKFVPTELDAPVF